MNQIKTILLAAGFSENTKCYFDFATMLAIQIGASLTVLHVMEELQEVPASATIH